MRVSIHGQHETLSLAGIDLTGPIVDIADEINERLWSVFRFKTDADSLALADYAAELACEVADEAAE